MSATGPAMRLVRAEAFRLRLALVHEFETSSHRKSFLEHVLVKVTDASGATGWGEIASASDPYYGAETVETCWLMLERHLAPAVLGAEWEHPSQAAARMARVRGNRFAKAGLDMACWDAWTRARGEPLAAALGGERRTIAAGVSLGIERTVEELVVQVGRHVAGGYSRVKLKIAPGWDLAPVRAVRDAHPELLLQVDANGAYTESAPHLGALDAIDAAGLLMIEQPFAPTELAASGRLQARLRTPICLDESIETLGELESALALGACRIVNIKVSRMGGLTAARAAHDACRARGVPVWCGGMHEFGVGRAANIALASLPGFSLPSDVSGSDKYFANDVVTPPICAHGGQVKVPWEAPGTGHSVDEGRVRAEASASFDLRA
jgi:o-succinylbenzoate synthase